MNIYDKFYIGGEWVASEGGAEHTVINPATEEPVSKVTLGTPADLDRAVAAAKTAFESFSQTSRDERLALLTRICEEYQKRIPDIAKSVSEEMGAPIALATKAQAMSGLGHFMTAVKALQSFEFSESVDGGTVIKEPIGVVGMITPWNWPLNQIAAKVAPCLAAGATCVLKPSEQVPGNAHIVAEIMEAAGVPAGVFNLVHGDGPGVGSAISAHPDIDMVSFTGSTRAGVMVAKGAADTVKRVHQELGGKSPNVILDDAALDKAIPASVMGVLMNSGQSCNAPTRLIVPAAQHDQICGALKAAFEGTEVGDPATEGKQIGPVVNKAQFDKIQGLIEKGVSEGATLIAGGPGRPDGLDAGYYVKPTVFGNVSNDMTIAQEEIFGPVLVVIPYNDDEEALKVANDTPYGLAAYVWGAPDHAKRFVRGIRAGTVMVNTRGQGQDVPFGGYKQSGNGREYGKFGIEEFLETKGIVGDVPDLA